MTVIWTSPWRRGPIFLLRVPLDPCLPTTGFLGRGYPAVRTSLIAFGAANGSGSGLGAIVEKLHYLPEAHTLHVAV